MRRFGTDAPQLFMFQYGDSDEIYKVPLAGSLPNTELLEMRDADNIDHFTGFIRQKEMLRKYIGDIVDEMSTTTISEILQAWAEESNKQGATVGESQALSD